MVDHKGFLTTPRELPPRRPVDVRIQDWREVYQEFPPERVSKQASRCMDCGIPFCHNGCPLGNLIPEWNDLVWREDWHEAIERLHATNNFPEFTGKLCPAPCEPSCVLSINAEPVTIKLIEGKIADRAWDEGWVEPQLPARRTGKRVAVIGSGPAGLAAAQQLTRAGHDVTVYERDDKIGGLLRYGIPEFKMEKHVLDRRLDQMRAEGTSFVVSCDVGSDLSVPELREQYDVVLLTVGATVPRDLPIPGRELAGIHFAMEYLTPANKVCEGDLEAPPIDAAGKRVVIIGGGDTGADCLGTALRQGATSVHQLEIMPQPPGSRHESTPWPMWPLMMRTSSAHEEGGDRMFAVNSERFEDDGAGNVAALVVHEVEMVESRFVAKEGTEQRLPCDLVLLSMGFTGPERGTLVTELGVDLDARGNIARTPDWQTSVPGVFVAGDAGRGQSLIVWAIAEGRAAAAAVDSHLMGATALPQPVLTTSRP
ncbi:MAG: glutamate synthase subunit beta [Actinomycetota bacterium]|nr:glutamate synthase subunit beta [Actinomycetota bacterium]